MRDDQRRLAFDLLYAEHAQPLYRFALRLSGSVEDAEDLASQALIQAYRKGHRFRGDSSMRTWLFTIVMNEWRMLCRKRPHLPERSLDDVEPIARTLKFEEVELAEVIADLPQPLKEAFLLVKGEGFTQAEAARICGVPEGTIAYRVHEAVKKLREALGNRSKTQEVTTHEV